MTPERAAELVARWVRSYTRDMAAPIADRRVEEIEADLRDHIAHERAGGVGDRKIARAVLSRMVRGLPADVAWRGRHATDVAVQPKGLGRSTLRVGIGVALILSLPLAAMLITDEVVWSLADFVLAGVLLATIGTAIELAVRKAGTFFAAFGIAVLGVAAALAGGAGDAPGLVLLGILLVASACALGVRRAQRRSS